VLNYAQSWKAEGAQRMTEAWTYEIQVQGRISERWAYWFDDMAIRAEGEAETATTTLTGAVTDQAALLGLLQKLYTLRLTLLMVRCTENASQGDGAQGEWREKK
jgi:hypothetical protein